MVCGVSWIIEHNAMLAVHHALYRVDGLVAESFFESDASHCAPSLTFDEDLSFLIFVRANLVAIEIVCAEEPFAVPSIFFHCFLHGFYGSCHSVGLCLETVDAIFLSVLSLACKLSAKVDIFFSGNDKQAGNHERLSLAAFALVFGGLEALVGIP